MPLDGYTPSDIAERFANRYGKDPRQVEAALRESERIVRMDRGVLIAETPHGFVCANAGVDASNAAADQVCLLPLDPDRSAANVRNALHDRFAIAPGVIISDSFGRPGATVSLTWPWGCRCCSARRLPGIDRCRRL
ncbi:MAG: coenzyme F420-0:L-glutamate ligase [Thermomicrobiales bacterium]